jgi:hypothetical protein
MTWNLQYDFYPKTASYIDDWKVGSYKESIDGYATTTTA